MFRNQVDTTVQFSKMIIQLMHDFVFKDHFFTVFKFKTMVGQDYHGPFLCFSDEFNFFPDSFFFISTHSVLDVRLFSKRRCCFCF